MGGIFISYRREDSGGHAGRLRDNLRARFGTRVFHDVDGIPSGAIFEHALEQAISTCQVGVIVIGPTWLGCTDEDGRRRLDDAEDWVRIEARMLLARNVSVIPVLVGDASMPRADELPDDLRALVKRQGRELRDSAWDADVEALVDRLIEIIGPGEQHHTTSATVPRRDHRWLVAGGVAAGVLLAAVAWTLLSNSSDPSTVPATDAAAISTREIPETRRFTVDFAVEKDSGIGDTILSEVVRDVQGEHITVARLLDSELASRSTGEFLDVDEVVPAALRNGSLRSADKATYTVLVTNRRLSRRSRQLDNLFYFAHHRFGVLSVRNFADESLAILIKDLRQGERVELLRKYLTAFIPLTALLGQADALNKTLIPDRGPATDHGCLSDYSNHLKLLVHTLRVGPQMCPDEYNRIASTFGEAIAADYKVILQAAERKPR